MSTVRTSRGLTTRSLVTGNLATIMARRMVVGMIVTIHPPMEWTPSPLEVWPDGRLPSSVMTARLLGFPVSHALASALQNAPQTVSEITRMELGVDALGFTTDHGAVRE